MKDLTENRLNEKCSLLMEVLSRSDEVMAVANNLYRHIELEVNKHRGKRIEYFESYIEWNDIQTFWGNQIKVHYKVYYFYDEYLMRNKINSIDKTCSFRETARELTLVAIVLLGNVYKELTESKVYHEIEHIYQWAKGKSNNSNFQSIVTPAYRTASGIIIQPCSSATQKAIAWIIYYSTPSEQDAFTHEYYVEATNSLSDFWNNRTNVEGRFNKYCQRIEWLKQNINDPDVIAAIDKYKDNGFTPKSLLTYAQKGLNRWKNKLNHIRGLIQMELSQPEEDFDD